MKCFLLTENSFGDFEYTINRNVKKLEEEGGTIRDIKFNVSYAGDGGVGYYALILYESQRNAQE